MRWKALCSIPVLASGLALLGWLGGCGADVDVAVSAADSGFPTIGASEASTTSACTSCRAAACRTETIACQADLDCTRYLACIQRCPLDSRGAPENVCTAACASEAGTGSVVQTLENCVDSASCPVCLAGFDAGFVDANACNVTPRDGVDFGCTQCQAARCCAQYSGCLGQDGGCASTSDCYQNCRADSGSSCVDDCNAALPESTGPAFELLVCAAGRCAAECGLTGSLLNCARCEADMCSAQLAAVSTSADAALLRSCRLDCVATDATCLSACNARHPMAVTIVNALEDCVLFNCPCQ